MADRSRASLKNAFLKGRIPSEEDFQDLIDSSVNKFDDGIQKTKGEAIKIQADGVNGEVLSFFDNIKDLNPNWYINHRTEDGNEGLNFGEPNGGSRLFLQKGGNVGIGVTRPAEKLDVAGMVAMEGRIGSLVEGEVPANGGWQDVMVELNEFQAFEITATVSKKGSHSILHAIVVSAYGKSKPGISKTIGRYGGLKNRLDLRWSGDYFNYQLQIRTRKNYGEGVVISYNVARLR